MLTFLDFGSVFEEGFARHCVGGKGEKKIKVHKAFRAWRYSLLLIRDHTEKYII